jgi:hypothetical protein
MEQVTFARRAENSYRAYYFDDSCSMELRLDHLSSRPLEHVCIEVGRDSVTAQCEVMARLQTQADEQKQIFEWTLESDIQYVTRRRDQVHALAQFSMGHDQCSFLSASWDHEVRVR